MAHGSSEHPISEIEPMAHGLRPVGTILGRRPGSVGCFSYSPLPVTWSPIGVFLGINIILGFLGWTGLARAVRSKLLAPREEDFCTVAVLLGARPRRVIARHLHPNLMSHLIASATLSIPSMILGETALSFLGLGLRPPITSLGGAPQRVGCQSTQRTPSNLHNLPHRAHRPCPRQCSPYSLGYPQMETNLARLQPRRTRNLARALPGIRGHSGPPRAGEPAPRSPGNEPPSRVAPDRCHRCISVWRP